MRMIRTRRCRGCSDPSPHDAHLTWLSRLFLRLGLWKAADS